MAVLLHFPYDMELGEYVAYYRMTPKLFWVKVFKPKGDLRYIHRIFKMKDENLYRLHLRLLARLEKEGQKVTKKQKVWAERLLVTYETAAWHTGKDTYEEGLGV